MIVCFDIETYSNGQYPATDVLTCIPRLITWSVDGGPVELIDLHTEPATRFTNLLRPGTQLVAHNVAFDYSVLKRWYPQIDLCDLRCTMIGAQLLFNGIMPPRPVDLASVTEFFVKRTLAKGYGASDWAGPLSPEQINYAKEDTEVLHSLYTAITEVLTRREMMAVYDLECSCIAPISTMKLTGVRVDVDAWTRRAKEAEVREAQLRHELLTEFPLPPAEEEKHVRVSERSKEPYASDLAFNERVRARNAVRCWNLGSPVQVLDMFRSVGIRLPNTRYETMVEMHDVHPILDKFLDWRDANKESGAFGIDWLKHVRNGRVHPDWRQLWPQSGRMACAKPNLQQVKRGEARRGITASPGNVFVRADFSQIEARVAAKISGDEVLIQLFRDGKDIHTYAAARILGKDESEVTKGERQIGKSLVFGLLFSMSAPSLRVYCRTNYGVKLSLEEAQEFRARFFRVFPGLAAWHARTRRIADTSEYAYSLMGRRRILAITPASEWEFNPATGKYEEPYVNRLGIMLNTPVQGTAADMLKASVREIWRRREEIPNADMVMLVHDEIVLDVPENDSEYVSHWLKDIMVGVGNRIIDPIPVDAEVKISKTWGG